MTRDSQTYHCHSATESDSACPRQGKVTVTAWWAVLPSQGFKAFNLPWARESLTGTVTVSVAPRLSLPLAVTVSGPGPPSLATAAGDQCDRRRVSATYCHGVTVILTVNLPDSVGDGSESLAS